MLTFKQVKENIINKFLSEITNMSNEINDDIIIEMVKNDINDKTLWQWIWDFDGMTENQKLLICIYDFAPVMNCVFRNIFDKYDDYEFDNPQDFVYKIFKEYLNEYSKDKNDNYKLYIKMLDNIYNKNKDLRIFTKEPTHQNDYMHDLFYRVRDKGCKFMQLYKCLSKYDNETLKGSDVKQVFVKHKY